MRNEVVVVTGAASGIGAAVTSRLRKDGWTTVGIDRAPAAGADRSVLCDLSDPASVDAALSDFHDQVSVLCNVAGVPGTAPPATVVSVNLLGLRHLTEAILPQVRDGGAVVNVASRAGGDWVNWLGPIMEFLATADFEQGLEWYERHAPDLPAYNFSKAALIVYTMQLSQRLLARGIRANSVSPGPVETPILGDFRTSMGPTIDLAAQYLGRHGSPEEVAEAVNFVASPAANWVNGQDLWVDGGLTAAMVTGSLVPAPVE